MGLFVALPIAGCVGAPPLVQFEGDLAPRSERSPIDDPAPLPPQLSLAEATSRALRQSAELQAALARTRRTVAEANQARLLPNPLLDVAFRLVEGGGSPQVDVGLSAELLALLTRRARAGAADARLESAAHEVVATALEVVTQLRLDYAEAQALTRRIGLLEERSRFFDRLVATARAKLETGEGIRLDLLTLEAQRLELDLEREGRETELALAHARLLKAVGAPSRAATFAIDPWSAPPIAPESEQPSIDAALAARPELLMLRAELRALDLEASVAGRSLFENGGAGLGAQRDGDWSVGPTLTLPLPLFDDGSAREEIAAARVLEASHRIAAVERQVVTEVRTAIEELRGALHRLGRVEAELLPIEQQRRDQVEAVYLAGESDVTALLLAERDLRQAQERQVELQQAASAAWAALEKAVGNQEGTR